MTQSEIRSFFPSWIAPFFYDVDYAKPTSDWLLNEFGPWFRKNRWKKDLDKWSRRNDCDNTARSYCVAAQDAHAKGDSQAEAIAVGEFCYIATTHVQGAHAIVCAFTEEGLIFIEPQTGQRLALIPTEIQSCFRVSF